MRGRTSAFGLEDIVASFLPTTASAALVEVPSWDIRHALYVRNMQKGLQMLFVVRSIC